MVKLFIYLKGYIGVILVIIVMLFVQAYSELSLPQYTSDIVNVGIQQGGVDTHYPLYISKDSFDYLDLFMSEEDKTYVGKYYNDEPTDVKLNYDGEVLYAHIPKEARDEIESKLSDILEMPMLTIYAFTNEETKNMMLSEMGLPKDTDVLAMIGAMDEAARAKLLEGSTSQMKKMPDSISEQMTTVFIQSEYEKLGIDMDEFRDDYIKSTGTYMLLLAALSMLAAVIVVYFSSRLAAAFSMHIREDIFKKVISFSSAEFDKFSTASLITRSTNDVQQVQMFMMMLFRIVLYAPIMGIGGIVKVLKTNNSMTWIIGLAILTILMIILCLFRIVMPRFKKLQSMIDKLNLVMREILTGLSVIRAFSTSKHEEERFDKANVDFTKTNLFVNRAMAFMMPVMMFIMNGVTILIVYRGASSIDAGKMQVGDMMAFIQYSMQVIMSFLMISMVSIMLPRAAVSGDRINEILETEPVINNPQVSRLSENNSKGEVIFDKVSFRYPDALEDVLTSLNFTAEKGKITAIIGSTGSGKSTLVNLIPRFFDVTEGSITYNGIDIRDMKQEELRDHIGYVPQRSVLFSGTIDSNIRFGKEDATMKEVEEAARIAQAMEFIEEKDEGFASDISQGGSNVSGGQKQRLSIARAIAKNPDIYIFDDSFSALDLKTDVTLRRALAKVTTESIVFIVAQRISTILHADQIIVLDEGNMVGLGSHIELMKSCEVYQQIASSQLSEEELANSISGGDR